MQIPHDKRITVNFRIEPGCLGPEGDTIVDAFCMNANKKLSISYPDYINWNVTPRHDKTLPELDYGIGRRSLSREHAERYLSMLNIQIEQFEIKVFDQLPDLIDQYFGR